MTETTPKPRGILAIVLAAAVAAGGCSVVFNDKVGDTTDPANARRCTPSSPLASSYGDASELTRASRAVAAHRPR